MNTDTKAVVLYPEVCPMRLDKDGGYYCRHVEAMTAEGLHRKSDITEQLGWRDREIDKLRTALAASRAEVEGLKKDAERYRWLKESCQAVADEHSTAGQLYFGTYLYGDIDSAIDAAMEKGNV